MAKITPPYIPRPHMGYYILSRADNAQEKLSTQIFQSISDLVDESFDYISTKNAPLTENRVVLPKELFETVDYTNMGVVDEETNHPITFIEGEKYALKGTPCEGFEMPTKIYELVAVHDKFNDIDINSIIVKQISGDNSKIFTLSKNDCQHIGIEYEPGLQLFPKDMKWELVKDVVPFNPHDLSTTPLSSIDNKIRNIVVKINGFQDYRNGYIITPNGKLIKEERFKSTFQFRSNEPFGKMQGLVPIEIVYPKNVVFNHGNFISEDNSIYIKLSLNGGKRHLISEGVDRNEVKAFDPNEHFIISWDELGAYTVEEYEELQAKKEKEKQERIAKLEALRKKQIEEKERQIKEQRENKEKLLEKMKGFKAIKTPILPQFPSIVIEDKISSMELYVKSVDEYFKSMDTSMSQLAHDLDKMSKIIDSNMTKQQTNVNNILDKLFPKI